jgi:hypothetical protein
VLSVLSDDLERWLGEVPTLHRVLPVAQERPATEGGRLVVASVELWGDRIKWNLAQFPPPPRPVTGRALPVFGMVDDADTPYRLMGGGSGGDGRWWTQYVTFGPAPSQQATALRLVGGTLADGTSVHVPLAA